MSVWLPIVIMLGAVLAILLWATIAGRHDPRWVVSEEEDEYITGAITETEDDEA